RPHGPLPAPRRDGLPLSGRPPGRAVPGRPDRPRRGRAAPESRVRRRPMTLVVVLLALAAAGLHAGWNVLLKSSGDPLPTSTRSLAASAAVVTPIALAGWLATGHPPLPPAGWLVLVASAAAELLYFIFLSRAYHAGGLSVVYPIARGTGPPVAVVGGLLILREHLTALELIGVVALLAGIWSVRRPRLNAGVFPALI